MYKSRISGVGHHVPEQVVTNHDLSTMMYTSDEWIRTRSGIQERRWSRQDTGTSDLAYEASVNAIENAGIKASNIELVIVGTISSDYFFPGVSAQIQDRLGLNTVGAFDIKAACSAFIYSLSVADQFIKTGMVKTALVIGADAQSKLIDKSTEGRDVSVLFGDGAGAAILTRSDDGNGILSTHLHCEGRQLKHLWMEAPGTSPNAWINNLELDSDKFKPIMDGKEVFKNAVIRFPEVIEEAMAANKLSMDDIQLIIPHQANYRISQAVAKRMGVEMDKVYSNIHKYGNTTAASIPIALSEALEENKISKGDHIILAAFGAGFTWASAAIKW